MGRVNQRIRKALNPLDIGFFPERKTPLKRCYYCGKIKPCQQTFGGKPWCGCRYLDE